MASSILESHAEVWPVAIDRTADFTALIDERLQAPELAQYTFRKHEPPPSWAAALIVRAVDQDILEIHIHEVDSGGWALAYEGPLLLNVSGGHVVSTVFWTYSKEENSRMFAQEAAISVAAAARLVLEFGHPVDVVQIESDGGAVDGVVYDHVGAGGRPILATEAKVLDRELRALVTGVSACGGVGCEETHRIGMRAAGMTFRKGWPKNQHRKCPFLVAHRPVGFLVVSAGLPDGEVFIARQVEDRFVLVPASLDALSRDRLMETLATSSE